jgi:hypothetical protein
VIRRAALLAILGLVLDLVLQYFWSFVKAVAASPSILIERGTVEFLLVVVSPVTLTLFLVALYWELAGRVSLSQRQVLALRPLLGWPFASCL